MTHAVGGVDLAAVRDAAGSVPDPEIRRTLAELDLRVEANGGRVTVHCHLTSPLCPSPFASDIGREVRRRVEELSGVERCTVVIQDHFIAEEIARQVNEEPVAAAAWL